MKQIEMALGKNAYKLYISRGLLHQFLDYVRPHFKGEQIVIITDQNVAPLYAEIVHSQLSKLGKCHVIEVKAGEGSKSFATLESIQEQLASCNVQRTDLLIALGGGVVGDLCGFAASTYLRGVDFIQIPTSLLAQIDSSIGGKTGINLAAGKNLVGRIYQPKAVLIDPNTLMTLPEKYIKDGIGEAIKYAMIDRLDLLELMRAAPTVELLMQRAEEVIHICCQSKKHFVETDEMDQGKRMILNFGHTIGHAIEKAYHHAFSHGHAVAIGMVLITERAEILGLSKEGTARILRQLLQQYQLDMPNELLDSAQLLDYMKRDKKALQGKVNLILVEEPGKPFIHPVPSDELHGYL